MTQQFQEPERWPAQIIPFPAGRRRGGQRAARVASPDNPIRLTAQQQRIRDELERLGVNEDRLTFAYTLLGTPKLAGRLNEELRRRSREGHTWLEKVEARQLRFVMDAWGVPRFQRRGGKTVRELPEWFDLFGGEVGEEEFARLFAQARGVLFKNT